MDIVATICVVDTILITTWAVKSVLVKNLKCTFMYLEEIGENLETFVSVLNLFPSHSYLYDIVK